MQRLGAHRLIKKGLFNSRPMSDEQLILDRSMFC